MLLLVLLLLLPAANAAVRWSPAAASGIELLEPGKGWRVEGGYAVLTPSRDYYHRATFRVKLAQPTTTAGWLTAAYLDHGYGLITISTGARAQDQWGIVRLNTGKVRRAVFRVPENTSEFEIAGIPQLAELTLNDAKPAYEQPPMVDPAVQLKRSLDLVISSGADAGSPEELQNSLATMRNLLPLARALGFNAIESYVKWNFVEPRPGQFDWSFYDAIVAECQKYGLRWFPLLVVGSAYTLPDWFYDSPEHFRYKCLEHGLPTDIPTIFNEAQVKYVRRFLTEFGKHYGSNPALKGVRLGPTANYGEAQYPATGAMLYRNKPLHTHLGYWVGDDDAAANFRQWLSARYPDVAALNKAWGGARYGSMAEVKPFLPQTAINTRMRADFATWYMDAMTVWCERWAKWAREAMPDTVIYQSSGGWGAVEIGTDYQAHTKSMAALKGGIRMTNENDSYVNNFCVTRPAASAARFYGARFGTEPAGFSSRRGVMNRLFNIVTNQGEHLFFYHGNLYDNDQAIDGWLANAHLLDQRSQPAAEIAVFYPDTANRTDDSVMRHLYASTLFQSAYALRSLADYDFAGEQMILDGALERYKVLVFPLSGRVTERPVIEKLDQWLRAGGTIVFPLREGSRTPELSTVEGDSSVFRKWLKGDTGKGRFIAYGWHPDNRSYVRFLRKELAGLQALRPEVRRALSMDKPEDTYWSVLANGKLVMLNYGDDAATVRFGDGKTLRIEPYTIRME